MKLLGRLPKERVVALSGGSDSISVYDFAKRYHKVKVLFVDHNTDTSTKARLFIEELCNKDNTELEIHKIITSKLKDESWEEFWRNERLKFFHSKDEPIITGHNLDDCVETWIWSSCHGKPKLIPYSNKNIIRPFLLTKKQTMKEWCIRNKLSWSEDESNKDTKYMRNHIRHNMMNDILKINPGIHKTISKKIIEEYNEILFQRVAFQDQ